MNAKKLKVFFLVIVIFYSNLSLSQILIELSDFGVQFTPSLELPDTVTLPLTESEFKGNTIEVNVLDSRGKSTFRIFDRKGNVLCSGQYVNSRDTLQRYRRGIRRGAPFGNRIFDIVVQKYFAPLPEGYWVYFKNGKEIRKLFYSYNFLN